MYKDIALGVYQVIRQATHLGAATSVGTTPTGNKTGTTVSAVAHTQRSVYKGLE